MATGTRTRAEKTKRLFVDVNGKESARADLSSVAGKIVLVPTGEVFEFRLDDLTPEVRNAAALFGIMTSVTNSVGRSNMSDHEMSDAIRDRLGVLREDKVWSTGASGPRIGDLMLAIERWYEAKGQDFTEDMREQFRLKLTDEETGEEARSKLLARESVRAHLDTIKAERAAQRAKEANERAADAEDEDDLL